MRERRQAGGAPLGEQRRGEAVVIVRGQRAIERMRREIGLHDDLARQVRAAGAARDLEQQRGEPLRRAEIGAVERVVGAEHADQRQAREIVALGEHLRADEDVDVAGVRPARARRRTRPCVCVLSRSMRAIRAAGKRVRQRALEPLRAVPERQEIDVAALRARARQPLGVAAVMAAQLAVVAVDDEPRAAARAARLPAARRAQERRREAAAIDEDQRLLAAREARLDRGEQRRADALDGAAARVSGTNA